MKKVMIAAGGTGGHIYPGLALAEVLIEKNPGLEVVFIGSSSRMEATLIPSAGYRFIGIEVKSTYGGLWNKVESAVSMIKEERECADILQQEKPDAVVGFGNYISVPVITAAHRLHIPTMISEQNSFMGKANRYLVRYADAVEAAYPSSIEGIAKARCLGNPQATHAVRQAPHPELLETYGLNPLRPFVFVMIDEKKRMLYDMCANLGAICVVTLDLEINMTMNRRALGGLTALVMVAGAFGLSGCGQVDVNTPEGLEKAIKSRQKLLSLRLPSTLKLFAASMSSLR